MKSCVFILAAVALTACGEATQNTQSTFAGAVNSAVEQGASTRPATRFAQLVSQGVPRLQVSLVGQEAGGVLRRDVIMAGVVTWLGQDGATMAFQDGFLRGTRGLVSDVLGTDIAATRAAVLAGRGARTQRAHSFLDGNNQSVTQVYDCTVTRESDAVLPISQRQIPVRLMQERCTGAGQSFTNFYWVRKADNTVVQSRQWLGEEAGVLSTRLIDS